MAQGSSAGVDFGYDAMGRRVTRGQWAGSPGNPRNYTLYAYDVNNHLIGEYSAAGTPISEYVWLGDIPVAVIKSDATAPGGFLIYAIHADHLDTPRVVVDAQNQVRWQWWRGEPFGNSPAEEQPTPGLAVFQQNLRFPGQQYESFGGRHYNHFRDYDPSTGRYIQSDPIGLEGGINTYAYVLSNPLSYVDPLGLQTVLACGRPENAAACAEAGIVSPKPVPAAKVVSREIWWPERTPRQWSCKARADCNDNIPGNCPEDPEKRFAFGGGTANDLGSARNEAKANATSNLQCQPKHVSCKCTGPKGEQYSGGC